jgi:hypothetical protein
MLPAVCPGDILEVRRARVAQVQPGQLVLYERDGRLVAHRVVEKVCWEGRTLLLTRGDRLQMTDHPVSPDELLGCVMQVVRGNRRMNPRLTFWGKIGSSILSNSEFCTRLLLRLRNGLNVETPQSRLIEAASGVARANAARAL